MVSEVVRADIHYFDLGTQGLAPNWLRGKKNTDFATFCSQLRFRCRDCVFFSYLEK